MLRSLQLVPRLDSNCTVLTSVVKQLECLYAGSRLQPCLQDLHDRGSSSSWQQQQHRSVSNSHGRHATGGCHSSSSSSSSSSWCAGLHQQSCHAGFQAIGNQRNSGLNSNWSLGVRHMSSQIARMREAQEKRLVQHEFRSPTLGVVVDAYQRPEPLLQTSVLLNPLKLFKLWWQKTRSGAYTLIAQTNASRSIPGYDKLLLRGYIADLYKKINEAQAKYQLEKIKDLVDEKLYTRMRAKAEERRMGRWDKMLFEVVEDENHPLSEDITLVYARMYKRVKESPVEWYQFTYRIRCKQRFAAYTVEGKLQPGKERKTTLVYGDPDQLIDVEDYWVFEYKAMSPVNKVPQSVPGARWRLVGRLSV